MDSQENNATFTLDLITKAREWAFVIGSADYTEEERKHASLQLERAIIKQRKYEEYLTEYKGESA